MDNIFPGWEFTPLYDCIDRYINLHKNVAEVYQYTSLDALFNGILRPQKDGSVDLCLLSTNCQYLNDPTEIEYGREFVDTLIFGRLNKDGSDFRNLVNPDNIYLSCFSTEVNHLPMWSMYGKEGKGIALGFDIKLLQDDNCRLYRCMYDFIELRQDVLQAMTLCRKKDNTAGNDPVVFSRYIAILHELIKNHCYEYEQEYRLVVETDAKPQYRKRGDILVPYIENHFPVKSIRTIIVGPRNDADLAVKSIRAWLHSIGLDGVNVVPSGLPFR